MKSNMNLVELATEIQRQQQAKHDYLVRESTIVAEPVINDGGIIDLALNIQGVGQHTITDHAHRQIGQHLNIPSRYYQRMMSDAPELLAYNVNHWLKQNTDSTRLVRTLDSTVRGFLSDRFKPLDNYEFTTSVLQEMQDIGGITVQSSAVTDTRMYLKAVSERIQGEVRKGDIVQVGVSLSNSEVGAGTLRIDPLIYRLVCLNGAIAPDKLNTYSRRHIGARVVSDQDVSRLLSDEARQADDKAFWLTVRDIVRSIFDPERLQQVIEIWRGATRRDITAPVPDVVEVTVSQHKLPESMNSGILEHLIRDGDLTQYGLGNAITRYSQDVEDYQQATELETIGASVMAMNDSQWDNLTALATALSA